LTRIADGTVDGKMAKQDVYVWKVEGKYSNGLSFLNRGCDPDALAEKNIEKTCPLYWLLWLC
jgi:hypothetical protein